MKQLYVKIDGIHCEHCKMKITETLLENEKIKNVTINKNIAHILYEGNLTKEEIIESILKIDYFTKAEYISDHLEGLKQNIKVREFILIFLSIILFAYALNKIFHFNIFNMIPTIDSSITYGMLIITGMLTSIHCISMCGALNLLSSINPGKKDFKQPILYNLGRVISYTVLGGVVGFLGGIFSLNDTVAGMIIVIASIIMLAMSLNMLGIIHIKCHRSFHFKWKNKINHSFIVGLLNGFMPCGPLSAMQVYALSTGSFFTGALSMFLFGIGTVPLMLSVGMVFHLVKGKKKILLNKVACIFIMILSLSMLNRGLLTLHIDVLKMFSKDSDFQKAVFVGDYQEIEFTLSYDDYADIVLQKDVPARIIIHVEEKNLTGCNNEIRMKEFGIEKKLTVGDNIIEFTPQKTGTYTYACWMNMIRNHIKVIDNESYFKGGIS